MLLEIDLDMPKSLTSFGKKSFDEIFIVELGKNERHLPLHRFCDHGGWPDPASLELEIKSVSETHGRVTVEVQCFVSELVATGCADIQMHSDGEGIIDVVLDIESGRCYLPLDSDDL